MIKIHKNKRNIAFVLMIFFLFIFLFVFTQIRRFIDIQEGSKEYTTVMLALAILYIIQAFFWFKAFFHWSKGKGYPGPVSILGLLGFPVGLIIMAILRDNTKPPPLYNK